jgi:hypothetical protein
MSYNSLKIGPNFFLQHFKNKIIYNFVKFVATKKVWQQIFFHPSLLLLFLDPGSEIQDLGSNPGSRMSKNLDPGSGINIPDPQHCLQVCDGWGKDTGNIIYQSLVGTVKQYTPLAARVRAWREAFCFWTFCGVFSVYISSEGSAKLRSMGHGAHWGWGVAQ